MTIVHERRRSERAFGRQLRHEVELLVVEMGANGGGFDRTPWASGHCVLRGVRCVRQTPDSCHQVVECLRIGGHLVRATCRGRLCRPSRHRLQCAGCGHPHGCTGLGLRISCRQGQCWRRRGSCTGLVLGKARVAVNPEDALLRLHVGVFRNPAAHKPRSRRDEGLEGIPHVALVVLLVIGIPIPVVVGFEAGKEGGNSEVKWAMACSRRGEVKDRAGRPPPRRS